MKKFFIAASLFLTSISALAFEMPITSNFPDFSIATKYEKTYVQQNAQVIAYAKTLGGSDLSVQSAGPNQTYTVTTDSGCAFNVKIKYARYPKISGVAIDQASCN